MFAMRPTRPYFGYAPPMMPAQPTPQMPPQMAPQQGVQGAPQAAMMPGQPQLPPQLLAQLAQLRGMGLGGLQQAQQPMFGRPGIQPITSGAYSLR